VRFVIEQGAITSVVAMLACQEPRIISLCLDTLKRFLEVGVMDDGSNPCIAFLEESGGLDAIEGLQQHENSSVYQKALSIIETFFSEEEVRIQVRFFTSLLMNLVMSYELD
jgi:importin subunit alpha-1